MRRFISYLLKPGSITFIILLFLLIIAAFSGLSSTPSNYLPQKDDGYVITNYDVKIDVDETKHMSIEESISVHFYEPSHGIYRYIETNPQITYQDKNGKVQTKLYDCSIYDFELTTNEFRLVDHFNENGYAFYAIGKTNAYCNADETFSFKYKFYPGDDRDSLSDIFYQNVIGTGWDTDIQNVNFEITFPTNVESENFKCYVGKYGKSFENNLVLTISGNKILGTYSNLHYGEAITVYNSFAEGYFNISRSHGFDYFMLAFCLALVIAIIILFVLKRRKSPIVEVVEFSAPDGITPTEAGYINDGKITGDDISALIVYWANKGYLKLDNTDEKNVNIIKIKDLPENAKKHEKILFEALFKDADEINSVELDTIGDAGFRCKESAEKECTKHFNKKPEKAFSVFAGISLILPILPTLRALFYGAVTTSMLALVILCVLVAGAAIVNIDDVYKLKDKFSKKKYWILQVFLIICIFAPLICVTFLIEPYFDPFGARYYSLIVPILLLVTFPLLERYTESGREILGKTRGLKNYIKLAEKDKMEALVHDDPSLFYQILPYAYVLGVSDVYMNKFKDIKIENPEWITGDYVETWLVVSYLNRSMNMMANGLRSSMVRSITSNGKLGGGGFGGFSGGGGGGGFSGGGFGGGGGGRF